jgi:hypothetical protein
MPVKIASFDPISDEEFQALRPKKAGAKDPAMDELLDGVESGQPMRVPLVDGQGARGLRVAISRAATKRGFSVETVEGDGFVAVRKSDEPRGRREKQVPSTEGKRRRGRLPKRRE